ncbi:MAG: hypothetical protein H7841_17305 [Magnetospirillum sp. WYHS-4]
MTKTIIRTTVAQIPSELSAFSRERRVEVRVIDATEEEETARVKLAVERAMSDPRPSIPAEEVFGEIRSRLQARKNNRHN